MIAELVLGDCGMEERQCSELCPGDEAAELCSMS